MPLRQLSAASLRSPSLSSTCTSFSASAKVTGETSGPTAGAVAKAGGAPGGSGAAFCSCLHEVTAIPNKLSEPLAKNCLRDSDMSPLQRILTCPSLKRISYQSVSRSVPKGRLRVAQDGSPGWAWTLEEW